jgi:hypothetical protein
MGYRMYLGKSPKNIKLVVDIDDGDGYSYQERSEEIKNLIELGKYVEWRKEDAVNLMGEDADTELYIVDKEFLLVIIEEYRKMNYEYHKKFAEKIKHLSDRFKKEPETTLNENDLSCLGDLRTYFNKKQREWSSDWLNVKLEPSTDGNITSSWSYEYAIFNLVHLLHTFDWESDDLLYYGY